MRVKTILLTIGLLGIASGVGYRLIGSSIDENGTLQEAFFLVPLAYGLILIGFGGYLLSLIIAAVRRR